MPLPSPLDRMVLLAISQVKYDRCFSRQHAVTAARNLIKIPGVMEVWSWGKSDKESHLQILLSVSKDTFERYTTLLGKAPTYDSHDLRTNAVLLVMHRIVTSDVLDTDAFWAAVEKTEESIECSGLSDRLFIMLVPPQWRDPSNYPDLQTKLRLPNPGFLQRITGTASLVQTKTRKQTKQAAGVT